MGLLLQCYQDIYVYVYIYIYALVSDKSLHKSNKKELCKRK